jgi:asparagine synthase (glutamine-hydrolysing)
VDVPGAKNEFEWAKKIATNLGLRHNEKWLSPKEYADALLDASHLLDEPLAEPMVGQLLSVCRLVRERTTVVLSGEGADETWFGYSAYRTHSAISMIQSLVPMIILRQVARSVGLASNYLPLSSRLVKQVSNLAEPMQRRYLGLNYFDINLKNSLYSEQARASLSDYDSRNIMSHLYSDGVGGPENISQMASVDCRAWLVDNTLLRSDHMSMAASVELRVPFLDHRMVELATRVPARFKVKPHDQKVILKTALADRLPSEIANRRKAGFPTPLRQLFMGDFAGIAEEHFNNPSKTTKSIINHQRALSLLAEHRSGRIDRSMVLFQLLMLEFWGRRFELTL